MHRQLLSDALTAERVRAVIGEQFAAPTVEQEISLRMLHQELGAHWDEQDAPAIAAVLEVI